MIRGNNSGAISEIGGDIGWWHQSNAVWVMRAISRLAAILLLGMAAFFPACAAEEVSLADLKAATRSLGFLQNQRPAGAFTIGIVYLPAVPASRALAQQTAERLRGLPGPNNAALRPELVSILDLANRGDGLSALYLLPGAFGNGVADAARRKHLLVLSNDPACLDQHCCMLMVRDPGHVEIVLDSDLAQAAGVTFSSVFAMMVKHK